MTQIRIVKTEPFGFFNLKYIVQWAVSPKDTYDWNNAGIYFSLGGAERRVQKLRKILDSPKKQTVIVKTYEN